LADIFVAVSNLTSAALHCLTFSIKPDNKYFGQHRY
jgi:hypothetical protein